MAKTIVDLDINALDGFSLGISNLSAERLGALAVETVNAVAGRTYDLSRERMVAGINLTDEYLRQRMSIELASNGKAEASIIASGAKNDTTVLGRFDAKPNVVPNRSRKGKRKGNAALGIAPGSRQLGVTVQVTRGSTKDFQFGFLLPLKRGTQSGGNGFGVFTRKPGSKNITHRYGPSVYQLFAAQIKLLDEEVNDDLETTLGKQIDAAVGRAFE